MTVKVAINGFGRIGRLTLRSIMEFDRQDIEVVAINDLGSVATIADLLKYDSVHGPYRWSIEIGEDWVDVGSGKIRVSSERDPANLPHASFGVDIALECTGTLHIEGQGEFPHSRGSEARSRFVDPRPDAERVSHRPGRIRFEEGFDRRGEQYHSAGRGRADERHARSDCRTFAIRRSNAPHPVVHRRPTADGCRR